MSLARVDGCIGAYRDPDFGGLYTEGDPPPRLDGSWKQDVEGTYYFVPFDGSAENLPGPGGIYSDYDPEFDVHQIPDFQGPPPSYRYGGVAVKGISPTVLYAGIGIAAVLVIVLALR